MNALFRNFIATICAAAIFMQPLFFSSLGLLGMEYEGLEESSLYVYYVSTIAGLALLAYVIATVKRGIARGELLLLAIAVVVFCLHALWVIFDPAETQLIPEFLIYMLLFGVPGFLSAATALKLNIVPNVIKISEIFVIVIAIGIIQFAVLPSLAGIRTVTLAGANYQSLSYYAAFTFGVLLVYSLHLPKDMRLKLTALPWFRFVSYGLMLGCAVATFLGGGRGAFLLLLAYLVIGFVPIFLNRRNIFTIRGLATTSFKMGSIVFIVVFFITTFWENAFIQAGYERATQFISSDGRIDMASGSSGRDVVYRQSLDFINQQPVLGYGPFGFRDKSIHAHNLFLEVWLQFGIMGLITLFVVGFLLLLRIIKNRSIYTLWALSLFLYPITMTMFSGAYLHSTIFLFGLTFFVMYSNQHQSRWVQSERVRGA